MGMDIEDEIIQKIYEQHDGNDTIETFQMLYTNSSGETTERTVDFIRFNVTKTKQCFYAYCHLKQQFREFSFKGVKKLFLNDKEIENPQKFLTSLYEKTTANAIDMTAFERQLDVVKAIYFFACSDELYKRLELNVVKKYAKIIFPEIENHYGKDFMEKIAVSSEDMNAIAYRAAEGWEDKYMEVYQQAIAELSKLKIERYAEHLKESMLFY